MGADSRAFWIRFAKSAVFLALGAFAHLWLVPSTRPARINDEVVVAEPAPSLPRPARPHDESVVARLERAVDDRAGAAPRSLLAPASTPLGSSSRVIISVEPVDAQTILDRAQPQASPAQQLAVTGTAGVTAVADADRVVGTMRTLETLGTLETSGSQPPPSSTAELQLASDGLSPAHRSTHEALALARPATTSDTPPIAGAARQSLDDEQMVRHVLQQYRAAYEQLDAAAAKSIWPTVDERALTHAFQRLAAQRLTFRSCGISITGAGASARCRGDAEFFPKIGAKRAYTASGEWVFDLTREQTSWRIVNATVR